MSKRASKSRMRAGIQGFVAERLPEARAARHISSKLELSKRLGVHPSTVTRWEDGTSSPDSETLTELSKVLYVRREYFLRPSIDNSMPRFHRTLASSLSKDINYQYSMMNWMLEISNTLQHYVDFPKIDIPNFLGTSSYKQIRNEDIEQIALDLRKHWNMGLGPCADVVPYLERAGFIVSLIEIGTSKLDGLCSWSAHEKRPHILLATDKMSFSRHQMNAAHEMAHAILHSHVSKEELKDNLKFIEDQAFRLASAFLLPSSSYVTEVSRYSLASLLSLKERWRVSVKAQIKRLTDLSIIDSDYTSSLYKLYSAKGWNRGEPLDNEWTISEPSILADAIMAIVNSGLRTKQDLLGVEFTFPAGDIENITNLPPGWFSEKRGEIIKLKPQNRKTDFENNNSGIIVSLFEK